MTYAFEELTEREAGFFCLRGRTLRNPTSGLRAETKWLNRRSPSSAIFTGLSILGTLAFELSLQPKAHALQRVGKLAKAFETEMNELYPEIVESIDMIEKICVEIGRATLDWGDAQKLSAHQAQREDLEACGDALESRIKLMGHRVEQYLSEVIDEQKREAEGAVGSTDDAQLQDFVRDWLQVAERVGSMAIGTWNASVQTLMRRIEVEDDQISDDAAPEQDIFGGASAETAGRSRVSAVPLPSAKDLKSSKKERQKLAGTYARVARPKPSGMPQTFGELMSLIQSRQPDFPRSANIDISEAQPAAAGTQSDDPGQAVLAGAAPPDSSQAISGETRDSVKPAEDFSHSGSDLEEQSSPVDLKATFDRIRDFALRGRQSSTRMRWLYDDEYFKLNTANLKRKLPKRKKREETTYSIYMT